MVAIFWFIGCARTEGYYKLSMREKAQYLQGAYNQQLAAEKAKQLVGSELKIMSCNLRKFVIWVPDQVKLRMDKKTRDLIIEIWNEKEEALITIKAEAGFLLIQFTYL